MQNVSVGRAVRALLAHVSCSPRRSGSADSKENQPLQLPVVEEVHLFNVSLSYLMNNRVQGFIFFPPNFFLSLFIKINLFSFFFILLFI